MHRFSRMHLSADVARRTLDTIDLEEKHKLTEGLALIAVIDRRRDYLEAGYSCMRDYCMDRLHMSQDRAYRRIQVAKAALDCPELFEYLADGRLTVTTASVLAPHLTPETAGELLAGAAYKSRPEIVGLLTQRVRDLATAAVAPTHGPDVQPCSTSLAPVQVNSLADLCGMPADDSTASLHAAPHAKNSRRGRVTPCAAGGHEVRLAITDEEYEDLRATQALLGHAVPSGDEAVIYARALKHYRAHLEKQRLGVKPGAAVPAGIGRGIPKPLQRLVWERDGARCTFESKDGHRCKETTRLELDHILPVAMGGKSTAENLRVLCRAHNQFEAERAFGREHMQVKRELAQRERARDRAAAEADVKRAKARPKARDEAHQARYDDIYSGLRGLGNTTAEAERGAEMADAMPDATLEECMKAALNVLSRRAAFRGDRLARCSA